MSDLHTLPLVGHDIDWKPLVRTQVYRTTPEHWWWSYLPKHEPRDNDALRHGPFCSWSEAYASAHRMAELL